MYGFCHIEIPSTDLKKSKEFYAKIFGWKMEEGMKGYIMFSTPDDDGGGFTTSSAPSKDGVILYIKIEDIEKKLAEIEAAGGKTIKQRTGISEEFGFFGLFTDPCGNIMGLWSKQ